MSDFTSSFHSLAKPFKEKVHQLSDKSQLYQYYSTLVKVTSSESSDIPGFVIEELIQISYENEVLATQLALYLADSLNSNSFKIKPAKSIHHLVRKGSRQFRKTLRTQKDDVLRKFANSSDPLVAKLCQEIRNNLFDEAIMTQDETDTIEEKPNSILSGMGSSLSADAGGFGNSPISKENLGHKVLDLIDKTMTVPDKRTEVLNMCLATSPTGEYQPVSVPMMNVSTLKMSQISLTSSTLVTGKKHTPGKAGGGWDSSDDEENRGNLSSESHNLGCLDQSMVSSDRSKDIMVESACEALEDIPEVQVINDYCNKLDFPMLEEVNQCFSRCQNTDPLVVLEHLKVKFEDVSNRIKSIRALLLLECYLRTTLISSKSYADSNLEEILTEGIKNCDHPDVVTKIRKVLLIMSKK